jgi:hypothetical protein
MHPGRKIEFSRGVNAAHSDNLIVNTPIFFGLPLVFRWAKASVIPKVKISPITNNKLIFRIFLSSVIFSRAKDYHSLEISLIKTQPKRLIKIN